MDIFVFVINLITAIVFMECNGTMAEIYGFSINFNVLKYWKKIGVW